MRLSLIAFAAFLTASRTVAQEHKWAGRPLDSIEHTLHEKLAVLPFYGVFDTVRFEIDGKTVTLSGSVVRESVKINAERAARQVAGVQRLSTTSNFCHPPGGTKHFARTCIVRSTEGRR